MATGIVYSHFNTINGKYYVGQTWKTIDRRWYEHTHSAGCRKFHNAIQKYGQDVWDHAVLFNIECNIENCIHRDCMAGQELVKCEQYWMDFLDSQTGGYNLRDAGLSGKMSEETRRITFCASNWENIIRRT